MSARYIGGLVYNPPGGWSGYFDGTGDYLSFTGGSATSLSADFTIEAWVYCNTFSIDAAILSIGKYNSNGGLFYIDTSGRLGLYRNSSRLYTGSGSCSLNTWTHVAYVRQGTTLTGYINGVSQGSITFSSTVAESGGIGTYISDGYATSGLAGQYLNGYLSNVRLVNGTAVYTSNFTPPSGALLPITNTSLLTCAYPTFRDGSTNNFTITASGNTAVNTANPFPTSVLPNPALGNAGNGIYTMSQYASLLGAGTWPAYDPYYENVTLNLHGNAGTVLPFNTDASTNNFQVTQVGNTSPSNYTPFIENGYWSNYFDGSGDTLSYASSGDAVNFTGAYTVECFFNLASNLTYIGAFANYIGGLLVAGSSGQTGGFSFFVGSSGSGTTVPTTLAIYTYGAGSPSSLTASSLSIPIGVWHHVAAVRDSSNVTSIFFNGTRVATSTISGTYASQPFEIGGDNNPAGAYNAWFPGYISNMRVVKGTAVYDPTQTTLTVPTAPLTAITNTSVLTCQSNRFIDNSTNAFTITPNGNVAVNPLQPFTAPTGTSAYGSGYFDGTGDWLNPPTGQTALTLSTSDFTIEMWAYPTTQVRGNPSLFASDPGIGLANAILVQFAGTTGQTTLWVNNVNLTSSSTTNYIKLNQWNHIAICRSGGSTYTFYINGVAVNNVATNSTSLTTSSWYLGYWTVADNAYTGYLSNFRIVKGTVVYTGAFTPPTTPLTAITNTSLLTVQTNAPSQNNTFLDSSTNNFVITRNGNTTQGTFTPYGANWSNYFDGSGDYLTAGSSISLSGNFTVEGWVYRTVASGNGNYLLGLGNDYFSTGATLFVDPTTGYLRIYTGQAHLLAGTSVAVPLNTWTHVAFVRSSNTLRAYLNGVQVDSASWSATISGTAYINAELNGNPTATVYAGSAGYISNLRVNTTAVYTAAFTPSTAPLTAISGTSLLTCQSNRFVDNSTNAYTITSNGDASVQRFSPFSPTSAYTTSVIGGSGYFDGSGDYLSTTNVAALRLGSGDFTVEAWINPSRVTNTYVSQIFGTYGYVSSLDRGWFIGLNSTGYLQFVICNPAGGAVLLTLTSSTITTANTWSHVAAVRSGSGSNNVKLYLNGIQVASGTSTADDTYSVSDFYIGTSRSDNLSPAIGNSGTSFAGYISSIRMVKGTAVYTSAFTPPTAPVTAISGTSLLLDYTNAAISDNAMMNDLETVGNAQLSTSVKKYGSASMYFDGSGDILSTPASQNFVFNGDFTVEGWVYIDSTMASSRPDNLKTFIFMGWNTGNTPQLYVYGNTTTAGVGVGYYDGTTAWEVAATVPKDQWVHIAYVRTGTALYGFVNGARYTINASISAVIGSSNTMVIAGNPNQVSAYYSYLKGYIDDLRITKGVARYTTSFTPPTSQVQDQ